ncbi:MAG: hypothetical protein RL754_172 [Bacteroidota bacterium]|jgi:glycosyltransferase involved in cell wall biosynthesis
MERCLSICVASYGDDVQELLEELVLCQKFGLPGDWTLETLISDQYPKPHAKASQWNARESTTYIHNTTNKGRSANRNFLAEKATGSHLLFLDADALPKGHSFLERYCTYLESNPVVIGGTAYKPGFKVKALRVRVGKVKEELVPAKRNSNPYSSFSAFNFAIEKALFQRLKFDPSLLDYGHEDTLFGLALKHDVQPILHIDNPAYHMGIDGDLEFMKKTRSAIDNLGQLIEFGRIDEDVQLFKTYMQVRRIGLSAVLKMSYSTVGKALFNHLSRGKGPLFLFDVYKLMRLSFIAPKIGRKMP